MLSTQLIIPNYLAILSHRRSATVYLETCPLIHSLVLEHRAFNLNRISSFLFYSLLMMTLGFGFFKFSHIIPHNSINVALLFYPSQEAYRARCLHRSYVTTIFHLGGTMYVTLWPSPPRQTGHFFLLQFADLSPWKSVQHQRKLRCTP